MIGALSDVRVEQAIEGRDASAVVLTDLIKVEGKVARNGAVESRLNERRPLVPELVRTSSVFRADACDPRVHRFPAVYVLDGRFSQEEVHVVLVMHGIHEVRCIQVLGVELFRPERRSIDQRIRS